MEKCCKTKTNENIKLKKKPVTVATATAKQKKGEKITQGTSKTNRKKNK